MFEEIDCLEKLKEYNFFIVRTPFQLINAYETQNYFNTDNNILVIIDNGTENNKNQLTNLIYDDIWIKVIRFGDEDKSNFFNYIKIIKELKELKINYLFIGSGFNKMQQILVANVKSLKTCFFDSGTNTMTTYNAFLENKINYFDFKKLRFRLFGLKTKIDRRIDFFTMFDLKDLPNHKIYKNKYEFMKKRFMHPNIDNKKEIYIIGQRFVDGDIIEEEKYIHFIEIILQKYKDYKINYLMHRTEKEAYLIRNGLDEKLNIIKSTMPGELYFLSLLNKPMHIIGTVSTLIISLKYIFDEISVVAYKFKIDDFKKNKELYTLEYQNMKNNGIIIEEL